MRDTPDGTHPIIKNLIRTMFPPQIGLEDFALIGIFFKRGVPKVFDPTVLGPVQFKYKR